MHLGGSGEPGQEILRYREEIRNGSRLGPTIYATDRILDGDPAIATDALSLSTADEAKLAVRNLKAQGLPVFGHIPRNFDALQSHTGRVLSTIPAPGNGNSGMAWADGELWHGTWEGDDSDLRRIDPRTGEVAGGA